MANPELPYASDYANGLLEQLGAPSLPQAQLQSHPALRWARSGAMALTGYPAGPAQMCPVPLASYADGIVTALRSLRPGSGLGAIDGACLLGERAALAGYGRAGDVSPGGTCRLLRCEDGWLALNLARTSDWELLPAWLEGGDITGWGGVAAALSGRAVEECLDRGRLLGLALAAMRPRVGQAPQWCRESYRVAGAGCPAPGTAPLVVDLSALWAGPLCTHLLQLMGAQVIKIESTTRPDGMRRVGDGFYELLNAGKASVALDLAQPEGRARLRRLLGSADIVVEASRPRALRQLGIHAEAILDENPGLTWISITGHGREGQCADWVGLGDDAAVAGGLSQVLWDASGRAMFCADALADPLTGLHAALAAWVGYLQGGGRLVSLALAEVVAYGIRCAALGDAQGCRARAEEWSARIAQADVARPRARVALASAREFGADTTEVLAADLGRRRGRRLPD
jgi:crotonobetainyl-CoA:carnitine CoA-transferase CaiB-like acyl-CoA transferase